ncbi:aminopeptidase N-like isoform X2 [Linepithema humile]|uniref:aminopeptidase N-like isoform X2 n=1 Tax=Linepithema humile TaxID=83485 RepID=UPI00351F071B
MTFQKFLLSGGLVLIATITITIPTANCFEDDDPVNKNLPKIVPLHYNVEIRFFFKDNILLGECDILININRSLYLITMNSVPVYINKAVIIDSKNITIKASTINNKFKNTLTIYLHKNVSPDIYKLKIAYARIIHENTNFSLPVYQDILGEKILNETGVEVMKALQLFPHMNESTINSTFKIAIKHGEEYTVLSNMPIRARNTANNCMMWTHFEEIVSMSLQHIRVVITTFTNISSHLANVTIWCRQSAQQQIYYAKYIIEEVIPYFKQKYLRPLSKLDIVALWHPQDDNDATLGLVLLREADIIYNETLHPVTRKREIAHIMARQLALLWCEDALLWSKEGFVTFFGAYILDQINKDDHMMNLMVVQAQQDSLRYDTPSTMYSPTLNSTNISQDISLGSAQNQIKSFIIWRMLYNIIPDAFWRGIHTYKNTYKHRMYLNTTPDDLWNTMQTIHFHNENDPKHMLSSDLKEIITNWITTKYYFVLNVTQYRFTPMAAFDIKYIQSPYVLVNDETKIWINVTYMWQSSVNFNKTIHSFWLTSNKSHTVFDYSNSNVTDWIIVNIQQTGYYRVHYDIENWKKLKSYLNSKNYAKIHILNRAQIIDDAFYFFLQRQLSYNLFWNLTRFVTRDANFVTWYPMIKVLESFACLYPLEYGLKVTRDMKSRINQLLTKIGYTDKPRDHTLTIYLRQEAVKWACILNVSECQKVATSKFNKELQNSVENSNLIGKKWIYCCSLRTANHTIWYTIWEKWKATSDESYIEYLTCSENNYIICDFLILLKKIQSNDSKWTTRRANAFLSTVAKHAKTDEVNSCLFKILKDISFSSNRTNDIIATLIVIITHSEIHMAKVNIFAEKHYEIPIIQAIESKIRKRRLEYGRLISNYGIFIFYFIL